MHVNSDSGSRAYASATITDVPSRAKDTHTPNRVVRVDEDLWRDYGEACTEAGTDRSEDLRAHMKRRVKDWKAGRWPRPKGDDHR